MTKRQRIHNKVYKNLLKIDKLKEDNLELAKQNLLLCDKEQWFEEKIESHPKIKGQRLPNELDGKLVGRVYWYEDFLDEDTNEVVRIVRQQVVRIDGEWKNISVDIEFI